jgi:riboflavin synthase
MSFFPIRAFACFRIVSAKGWRYSFGMFTGIIETTAKVLRKTSTQIATERPPFFDDLKLGASVAISGVCLTVIGMTADSMTFDVVPETWAKTTLGDLKEGDTVNLERAMRADGRFDGHIVQGHVEGEGRVTAVHMEEDGSRRVEIALPEDLLLAVVPKGSITLHGISLTVARVQDDSITVAIIPETLQRTNFGLLRTGDRVNVETDVLGRYVRSILSPR